MRDLTGLPKTMGLGGAALVAVADNIICEEMDQSDYSGVALDDKGKLTLIYTPKFAAESEETRSELLEHEAGHIAFDFFARGRALGADDKDTSLWDIWNIAHDCAINEQLNKDVLPPGGATFEACDLPVAPAEVAYELLKERATKTQLPPKGWCNHKPCNIPPELFPKLLQIVRAAQEGKATIGTTPGEGSKVDVLPFVQRPKWLDKLEALLMTRTRLTRRRTWLRDTRRSVYVRGRQRKQALERTGLVLLDTSGSMWADLPMLLAQVTHYMPECEGAVWDTVASPRGPVRGLYDATTTVGGGGTDPRCAAALRREGELVIWITDCEVMGWPEMTKNDVVVQTASNAGPPHGVKVLEAWEK